MVGDVRMQPAHHTVVLMYSGFCTADLYLILWGLNQFPNTSHDVIKLQIKITIEIQLSDLQTVE